MGIDIIPTNTAPVAALSASFGDALAAVGFLERLLLPKCLRCDHGIDTLAAGSLHVAHVAEGKEQQHVAATAFRAADAPASLSNDVRNRKVLESLALFAAYTAVSETTAAEWQHHGGVAAAVAMTQRLMKAPEAVWWEPNETPEQEPCTAAAGGHRPRHVAAHEIKANPPAPGDSTADPSVVEDVDSTGSNDDNGGGDGDDDENYERSIEGLTEAALESLAAVIANCGGRSSCNNTARTFVFFDDENQKDANGNRETKTARPSYFPTAEVKSDASTTDGNEGPTAPLDGGTWSGDAELQNDSRESNSPRESKESKNSSASSEAPAHVRSKLPTVEATVDFENYAEGETGAMAWPSAVALCCLLCEAFALANSSLSASHPSVASVKHLLPSAPLRTAEFGCGPGLSSAVLLRLVHHYNTLPVFERDRHENTQNSVIWQHALVDFYKSVADTAAATAAKAGNLPASKIGAIELQSVGADFSAPPPQLIDAFDLIIATEVVYDFGAETRLLSALMQCLRPPSSTSRAPDSDANVQEEAQSVASSLLDQISACLPTLGLRVGNLGTTSAASLVDGEEGRHRGGVCLLLNERHRDGYKDNQFLTVLRTQEPFRSSLRLIGHSPHAGRLLQRYTYPDAVSATASEVCVIERVR